MNLNLDKFTDEELVQRIMDLNGVEKLEVRPICEDITTIIARKNCRSTLQFITTYKKIKQLDNYLPTASFV